MRKAKSVDEYIKTAPEEIKPKLNQIRRAIKSCAPGAEEKISYGMPYYSYKGRLAYFRYSKSHLGLYLMPPIIQNHKKELVKYKTSKGTIRFPFDWPLPIPLIIKVVKEGVKQNEKRKK